MGGRVLRGGCTCMAGEARVCSHVGAILWKVDCAVTLGLTGRACTDVVAQWNQGTKRNVQPGKIAEMTFHLQPATVDPEVQRQPAAANVLLSEVEIHEMHRDSGYPDLFSIPGTMSYRSCARLRSLEQFCAGCGHVPDQNDLACQSGKDSHVCRKNSNWCKYQAVEAEGKPRPPHKYKLHSRVAEALLPVCQCLSDPSCWNSAKTALVSEFSSVDAKRRLKEELDQRTQHPEENLKEFIYTIAAYYERIGEEVPESEKVNRVVRQMHPQLQDLAEGKSFATLAELAKAADEAHGASLAPISIQAATSARQSSRPGPGLLPYREQHMWPNSPPAPFTAALSAFPTSLAQPTGHGWPLHPAALQPAYLRDQFRGSAALSTLVAPFPSTPRWRPQSGLPTQCHRYSGISLATAQPTAGWGLRRCASDAGSRDISKLSARETALLDTGSSVSLLGSAATAAAQAAGSKTKMELHTLRLASGWFQASSSLKSKIYWGASNRRQRFICVPDLCRDVVLGRHFLTATGMSLHVALGGWTVGTDPQCVVPFCKMEERKQVAQVEEDSYCLPSLFGQVPWRKQRRWSPVTSKQTNPWGQLQTLCRPETAASQVGHETLDPRMQQVLRNVSSIFTETPGCTTLVEHHIRHQDSPPVRCKLRPSQFQEAGNNGWLH
ncbi:hypothetical protein HPB48_000526 [Haemaphysalis longicornis]|uniref:Uncharacterized protein n=1 Tax=Haemaphysalis longicornis TaxID=44386 RepID=A0A9J6GT27_HAELO|nr:hypothetical protein HPB48_000526 [Haemaphysalis longicornis]